MFRTQESKTTQIIGCLAIIFTMTASTFYHLFNAMSKYHNDLFLKIDMMGIGIMIFTLTLVLANAGYYAHDAMRKAVIGIMLAIFIIQLVVQFMPCYLDDRYEWHRTAFYTCVLLICIGLALSWLLYFASKEEVKLFAVRLFMSFVYLGIGFWLWVTHYPEKLFRKSKLVQYAFQSHIFWHLFVTLSGYTLYWLLYDFNVYIENK